MALADVRHICAQQTLLPRPNRLNKGPHETHVTAPVATAFGGRLMNGRLASAEVRYGERVHVADDLAMCEM